MAQSPFADYFNHTSSDERACSVSFSKAGYAIATSSAVKKGEEVYISYGNHSNDFLLAEYGFILGDEGGGNEWDEIVLDEYIMPLLSMAEKINLKDQGFLGNYVLDRRDVCFRTQVAMRLLSIQIRGSTIGSWRAFVYGKDDGEKGQKAADQVLLKVLRKVQKDVRAKIEAFENLGSEIGDECQRDMLRRRWEQIGALVQSAVDRIPN